MAQDGYKVGMSGEKPVIPAKGYTRRITPDLNREIQKKYSNTDLAKIERMLEGSFADIQKLIQKHNDEELFERKRYKWTGIKPWALILFLLLPVVTIGPLN